MVHDQGEEPSRVGEALHSTRAAIDMVAGGGATRITIHAPDAEQILPAARALARAAGVTIEPIWWADDAGCDIVIAARSDGSHG